MKLSRRSRPIVLLPLVLALGCAAKTRDFVNGQPDPNADLGFKTFVVP